MQFLRYSDTELMLQWLKWTLEGSLVLLLTYLTSALIAIKETFIIYNLTSFNFYSASAFESINNVTCPDIIILVWISFI